MLFIKIIEQWRKNTKKFEALWPIWAIMLAETSSSILPFLTAAAEGGVAVLRGVARAHLYSANPWLQPPSVKQP